MKAIHASRFLLLLCSVLTLSSLLRAEDGIIRLVVFSMAKAAAARLLAGDRLLKEPAAVIGEIKQMQSRNEATLVATPALQGAYPFRTQVTGDVMVEVDAGLSTDKSRCNLNIFVGTGKPGHSSTIRTWMLLRRGKPKFLGTLEPAAIDPGKTWMVFVYAD